MIKQSLDVSVVEEDTTNNGDKDDTTTFKEVARVRRRTHPVQRQRKQKERLIRYMQKRKEIFDACALSCVVSVKRDNPTSSTNTVTGSTIESVKPGRSVESTATSTPVKRDNPVPSTGSTSTVSSFNQLNETRNPSNEKTGSFGSK